MKIYSQLKSWKADDGQRRMTQFTKNIETFLKFKIAVRDLFRISESMPQEYCNENGTSALGYEDLDTTYAPPTRPHEPLDIFLLNSTDSSKTKV